MKITCPSCSAVYNVPDSMVPRIRAMGELQCSACGARWTPHLPQPRPAPPPQRPAAPQRPSQQRQAPPPQRPQASVQQQQAAIQQRQAPSQQERGSVEQQRQRPAQSRQESVQNAPAQRRQQPPQSADRAARIKRDLSKMQPLDKEVSVDWGGEDQQANTQKTTPQNKKFQVRRSPSAQARKTPQIDASQKRPQRERPFAFKRGEKPPTSQGFSDGQNVSTKEQGRLGKISAKFKDIVVHKNPLTPLLGKIIKRDNVAGLIRKEQFWTWAWFASFLFLLILFFMAYFNWESILHIWPAAGRIYHPD